MHKLISPQPDKVAIAEVDAPSIQPDEVLVRAVRSLISPGSELNRVRRLPGDTDDKWPNHDLGYAMCGEVVELGADVEGFAIGDRVMTMGHHQQFVASSTQPGVTRGTVHLPDELSWDEAPFMIWSRSCANWTMKADIALGETVAIMALGPETDPRAVHVGRSVRRQLWVALAAQFSTPAGVADKVVNREGVRVFEARQYVRLTERGGSSSLPMVVAEEAAEDRTPDNLTFETAGYGAVGWMQLQRPVRPPGVVVAHELGESPSKVAFVQDDDVVQALVAYRADPAFCATIQIG